MLEDDLFDPEKRNRRLWALMDKGKEGIVEGLTKILEKIDELESKHKRENR